MRINNFYRNNSTYSLQPVKEKGKMGNLSQDNQQNGNSGFYSQNKEEKKEQETFKDILGSKIDIRV